MLVTGPAMVATGSYGPKGFATEVRVPQGAEEADGLDGVTRVARDQIGHGVDLVKVYADYRWGPNGEARPTFTLDEITRIVEVARSSGRPVVAHAATAEGMRRAILGGVETIEHGDDGTPEIWKLMAEKGVAFCPTLAAPEATAQYAGWKKGVEPGARAPRAEARDLQGGARRRRDDLLRRRRRRLRARRQRARAGADGALGHDAAGGHHGRDVGERRLLPPRGPRRPRSRGPARGPHRRRRRSDRRHRGRCGA